MPTDDNEELEMRFGPMEIAAFQRCSVAAKAAGVSMQKMSAGILVIASLPKPRPAWWRVGRKPPEFAIDVNKHEWWQLGDDDHPFGQAV